MKIRLIKPILLIFCFFLIWPAIGMAAALTGNYDREDDILMFDISETVELPNELSREMEIVLESETQLILRKEGATTELLCFGIVDSYSSDSDSPFSGLWVYYSPTFDGITYKMELKNNEFNISKNETDFSSCSDDGSDSDSSEDDDDDDDDDPIEICFIGTVID